MRKSLVIATCLANAGMQETAIECEFAIKEVFHVDFPSHDYNSWNTNIEDEHAANLIKAMGRASTIRIDKCIADLWERPYRWNSDRKIAP